MSKNFTYPPEYWKLKKENELLKQEYGLLLQIQTFYEELVRLKNERVNLWLSDLPAKGQSMPIHEECKVIKFRPLQLQQGE